jgi:hypothetical protein
MVNERLSKEKQPLVLAGLYEGAPIEAVARMFKPGTNIGIAEALAEIKRQCAPGVPNQTHRNGMAASDAVISLKMCGRLL